YFELLHILEFKKAERVKDCAEVLEYKVSYETGEKTLYRVWFCKSRLCPMCNWRRAMKHGIQSQKVVAEVIKQKPTVRWRSEEHTSELQSRFDLVCRLLLEK